MFHNWRHIFILSFFSILYLFLISNIYNIQFNKNGYYKARLAFQLKASGIFNSVRGNIIFVDKNNNPIPAALNKDYNVIFAVPDEIKLEIEKNDTFLNFKDYAKKLSPIINIPAEQIEKKISKKGDEYELLAQKVSSEQADKIKELNLKGIYLSSQKLRYYPYNNLASHILGFVSPAKDEEIERGRYGLEFKFDSLLAGKAGEDGENIILTIDRNIQSEAEDILKKLIDSWGAAGGSIIVQEPKSGRILTMASFPNFDPNNYSQFEIKNFLNPVTQAIYEPGSVFKLITMAAGIDSGKITSETTYIDTGSIVLNGRKIENWDKKAHGKQTMAGVIEQSINTGTVFAERTMGHSVFYSYLKKFGFDEISGINLPSEVSGTFSHLKKGRDIDYATASFGQGVAVTPIKLISVISAIANGGVLMKPLLLADENPEVINRVVSENTAKAITQMMVSAVKKNIIADIPNYKVAGKTGTAFIPNFKTGGYTDDVINSYVGFAPAGDPKFVILIKLDKPKGSPLAGQTVVPVFRELAQYILNYYNIPPDDIINNQ